MRRWFDRALVAAGPLAMTAWLAGWLSNDQHGALVWLFFIPSFVAAVFGLLWLWTVPPVRGWTPWVRLLTGLALLKVFVGDVAWHTRQTPPPDSLRIVHWNIARARLGSQKILDRVAGDRPDLVLFSESPREPAFAAAATQALSLPEKFQADGMLLLSRYPITPAGEVPLNNGRAWSARIFPPGSPLDLLAVDLISHPLLDRAFPMAEIARWVEERKSPLPLLILGDFNTQRDAASFEPLRRRFTHAYESAGSAWPYSWPWPIPVYAIDHAWLSPGLRAFNYRLRAAPASDHLRQVFNLQVSPPALPPGL